MRKTMMVAGAALLALGGLARAETCDPKLAPSEVLAADEARYAALQAVDVAALERLLGNDLFYTHSSTQIDDKGAYIESVRTGKVVYRETLRSDVRVVPYGCMAVMTGRGDFKVELDGKPLEVHIRFTNVWEKRGIGWQMVAWQATRFPPKP
jgi:hypothetical protein